MVGFVEINLDCTHPTKPLALRKTAIWALEAAFFKNEHAGAVGTLTGQVFRTVVLRLHLTSRAGGLPFQH